MESDNELHFNFLYLPPAFDSPSLVRQFFVGANYNSPHLGVTICFGTAEQAIFYLSILPGNQQLGSPLEYHGKELYPACVDFLQHTRQNVTANLFQLDDNLCIRSVPPSSQSVTRFWVLLTSQGYALSAIIAWSKVVNAYINEYVAFESQLAYFTTLGGAYATLKVSDNALAYAHKIHKLAKRVREDYWEMKSKIFITLSQIQLRTITEQQLESFIGEIDRLKSNFPSKLEEFEGYISFLRLKWNQQFTGVTPDANALAIEGAVMSSF